MNNGFHGINDHATTNRFGVITYIGQLPITYYGIFAVLAFILVVIIASIKLRHFYRVSYDPAMVFCIIVFPLGIVAASIWSNLIGNSPAWYSGFTPGSGGLAIQGALVVGVIFALIWFPLVLKKSKYWVNVPLGKDTDVEAVKRVSSWIYFDAILPVVLLGQSLGRWGNFFNYEVFGNQISVLNYQQAITAISSGDTSGLPMNWLRLVMPGVWYNMWISQGSFNSGTLNNPDPSWSSSAHFYQPLFLYESFFNVIFFLLIYFLPHFWKWYRSGFITGTSLIYTGTFRSVTEPMRFKSSSGTFQYQQSIVLSALIIVVGILVIIAAWNAARKVIRHVKWFEFGFDWIKYRYYRSIKCRSIAIKYAYYQDLTLKTNLGKKVVLDIKRLANQHGIHLTNYVIGASETKYFGQNWVYLGKNRRFWVTG